MFFGLLRGLTAPAPARSCFVVQSEVTDDSNEKLQKKLPKLLEYAVSSTGVLRGDSPRLAQLEMPDYVKQSIKRWLKSAKLADTDIDKFEVDAVILGQGKPAGSTAVDAKHCSLPSLPPEMRNRIYRFALVENTKIAISASAPLPVEPGLLRTRSQIRSEAKSIYL